MSETLERRLKALEDERDLRALLSFYGMTADLGMREDYVQLFTEDGIIEYDAATAPPGRFEGHEQIRNFINGPSHTAIEGLSQHYPAGPTLVFYIDGDEAVAEGYQLNIVRQDRDDEVVRRRGVEFPVFNIAWRRSITGNSGVSRDAGGSR